MPVVDLGSCRSGPPDETAAPVGIEFGNTAMAALHQRVAEPWFRTRPRPDPGGQKKSGDGGLGNDALGSATSFLEDNTGKARAIGVKRPGLVGNGET